MRLRLLILMIVLCLSSPVLAKADGILYTFSADYHNNGGTIPEPPGSTVEWQFEVPSLLTTTTTITSFISASLGSGFSGCGGVSDVQLPLPGGHPGFSGQLITDFVSSCGPGNQFDGAGANFLEPITSLGVFEVVSTHNGAVLGNLTISAISAVPEPSVIFLLGTGLLALLGFSLLKSRYSWNSSVLRFRTLPARD
jgi:hypothetical protein